LKEVCIFGRGGPPFQTLHELAHWEMRNVVNGYLNFERAKELIRRSNPGSRHKKLVRPRDLKGAMGK